MQKGKRTDAFAKKPAQGKKQASIPKTEKRLDLLHDKTEQIHSK